jgi:hypothetical protein
MKHIYQAMGSTGNFSQTQLLEQESGGYILRVQVGNQTYLIMRHDQTMPRIWRSAERALRYIKDHFGSLPTTVIPT